MDLLSNIFLGCFIFGLVFTIASFLLGGLGHLGGANGIGHGGGQVGHLGHMAHGMETGHHPGDAPGGGLNWLNFNAIIVFITWFGGAGFVVTSLGATGWWSIPIAVGGGIIGYFAILFFFAKVLYPSQTPFMNSSDYDLTGTVGRVSSSIFENGIGEVIYTKFGTRRSAPARSANGQQFPKETQVVILRVENGVVFVDDLDKLLNEAGGEQWAANSQVTNVEKEIR